MAKAIWEDTVIAETDDVVMVEGNSYFPGAAVHFEYLKPSSDTTFCPWKGTAHYYDVEVNGKKNAGAAWYYPEPSPAAEEIRGCVAFWRGVKIE
jgi:uncharacterized protein (DUF427 family)